MTPPRPFRFSAQVFSASSAKEWRETAQHAESLGYSASEARRAASAVAGTAGELDVRIKAALQELARSR